MQIFYDQRTDRTFFTQPTQLVVGSVLLALALLFVALCIAMPWIERDPGWWLWVLEAVAVGFVLFLLWVAVEPFTETVVTFDGKNRTLTVDRTQPWRHTAEA